MNFPQPKNSLSKNLFDILLYYRTYGFDTISILQFDIKKGMIQHRLGSAILKLERQYQNEHDLCWMYYQ